MRRPLLATLGVLLATSGCARAAAHAETPVPPPPHGPHPRVALTPAVLAALKAKVSSPGVEAALSFCRKAKTSRGTPDGYQGDEWAFGASAKNPLPGAIAATAGEACTSITIPCSLICRAFPRPRG